MNELHSELYDKHSLYDFTVKNLAGEDVSLSQFKGFVSLIVNTASECGFTGQYKGLQELYQKFNQSKFIVLGFPSNDYGGQEPGDDSNIKEFCELKFKTTFPIFSKGYVRGPNKQPVYQFLTEKSPMQFHGDPGWNFVKFLIDKEGKVVNRFSSITSPTSKKILKAVEDELSSSTSIHQT